MVTSRHHPLTPPLVRPCTISRWHISASSSGGMYGEHAAGCHQRARRRHIGDETGDDDRRGLRRHRRSQDDREQIVVPSGHEGEDRGSGETRRGNRYQDPPEHLPPAAAIDQGGLFQRSRNPLKIILHQPDRKRQRQRQIGDRQRSQVIEQMQRLDGQIQWHDQRDTRHHARAEIRQQQRQLAREAEAREAVASERPKQQVERRRCGRRNQRVEDPGSVFSAARLPTTAAMPEAWRNVR